MFKKTKKSASALLNQIEILTLVGEDCEFNGNIKGKSTLRIEGEIIGNVFAEKGLILGEKGSIKGNVETESAVIYGTLNGNIKAQQLEIKHSGCVNGDIKTDTIAIEMGAQYNGKLEMKNLINVSPEVE